MTIKTLGYEIRPDRVCWPQCYHQEEHEPHQTDQRGINKKKQGPKRLAWSARKLLYVKSGVMGSPWDYELSIKIWTQKMDRTFKRQFLGLPRKIRWVRIPPPPQKKTYKNVDEKKPGKTNTHPTIYFNKRGEVAPFRERTLPVIFDSPPFGFLVKKNRLQKAAPFFFEFPAPSPATGLLDFFSESKQDLSMKIRFDVKWGFKEICTTNLYWNFVIANCLQWLGRYLGHLHVTQQVFEKQLTK